MGHTLILQQTSIDVFQKLFFDKCCDKLLLCCQVANGLGGVWCMYTVLLSTPVLCMFVSLCKSSKPFSLKRTLYLGHLLCLKVMTYCKDSDRRHRLKTCSTMGMGKASSNMYMCIAQPSVVSCKISHGTIPMRLFTSSPFPFGSSRGFNHFSTKR